MQHKSGSRVEVAVEAKDVARNIGKVKASEDEKALRMRYGVAVDPHAPLARHGEDDEDLRYELLLMEMDLLRAFRQHQARQAARTGAAPLQSRTKDKIVRALRKKH